MNINKFLEFSWKIRLIMYKLIFIGICLSTGIALGILAGGMW